MADFTDRLKKLRKEKGLYQKDLAKSLNVGRTTIGNYEQGIRFPDKEILNNLADYFNVSIDYLLGRTAHPEPSNINDDLAKVPVLGNIQAGSPVTAVENIEGYRPVTKDQIRNGEYFYLEVRGDSMINSRIHSGDYVLIKKQNSVENGTIAVVLIDDEATLKKVYQKEEQLILQPDNPEYEPIIVFDENVRIIGKVVKVEFDL